MNNEFDVIRTRVSGTPVKGTPAKGAPKTAAAKPKTQSFPVAACAVFREKKVQRAIASELRLEVTGKAMDLVVGLEFQTRLCLPGPRIVLHKQEDKKSFMEVAKAGALIQDARAVSFAALDSKSLVLILDADVFDRLEPLLGELFVNRSFNANKFTAMRGHMALEPFLAGSSSIHSPSVAPRPTTTTTTTTTAAPRLATAAPFSMHKVSHLEINSDPVVTCGDCLVHVSPDALSFSTIPKTDVKFSTIGSVWFQPFGNLGEGTPMGLTLKSGLRINFVLCKLYLSSVRQVRAQFVNFPKVLDLDRKAFDWDTGEFTRSSKPILVDKLEQLPPPAPKLSNDRPTYAAASKTPVPRVGAMSFAFKNPSTFMPPRSAASSPPAFDTPKSKHRNDQQRPFSTYSTLQNRKQPRLEEEEEIMSLITPTTARRSGRLAGRSPSSAEDAKVLFVYPSANSNASHVLDWGFDTITVRQMDRNTLRVGEYLNDSVIDFYAKYCFREHVLLHAPEMKQDVHVMSSFLFSRMDRKIGRFRTKFAFTGDAARDLRYEVYSTVRYWSRGVDLFTRRFLLVPINKSTHWSLAIVYLEPREGGEEPPQVTVYTLDSLGKYHAPTHVGNVLRLYLDHEWKARALALEQGKQWPLPARSLAVLEEEEDEDEDDDGSVHSSDSDYCQIVDAPSRSGMEEDGFTVDHPVFASTNPKATVSVKVPLQNDGVNCGIFALRNLKEFVDQYYKSIKSESLFEDGDEEEERGGMGARLEAVFGALRFSDANGFRRDLQALMDKLAAAPGSKV